MSTTPTPIEDQGRLLEEALGVVRQQSHMMRKCLESPGKLMDALKCAYVQHPSSWLLGSHFLSHTYFYSRLNSNG
jgi:hypothetical protein